jgi:RNA polymerase-binding transcription factor DksA
MDIKHFKEKLEEEKATLEKELGGVGRINPDNPQDWEPTPGNLNIPKSDKNDMGDAMEEYEGRMAVEVELENRLDNIKKAIEKIEKGTYGKCKIDGGDIETDRLEANPAAETCKEHINE